MRTVGPVGAPVAAGYRGFRVSADVTKLVDTPERHDAFVRYEARVERLAAQRPFSAMCACDGRLGRAAVAELACVHPAAVREVSPFHVFTVADGALALHGEVDAG